MNALKTLAVSAALVAGAMGAANASTIYTSDIDTSGAQVEFGTIVADAPATLALYDYTGGVKGKLISTVNIDAGYNSDVRVPTNSVVLQEVKAELSVGGAVVDSAVIDYN
ncbi:hypothetical protein [Celeribacter sp.]|uniref:hypothetical protein n=1 Tax=Celeribacter sp. TaxID=1890673 RepID=UPI003A8F7991